MSTRNHRLTVFDLVLLPTFGVLMYVSKLLMEFLPNIHLLGMFITVFTLVYRWMALIPIYVYVFLVGLFGGFAFFPAWFPNLYTWTVLWGMVMLLPRRMPHRWQVVVYPAVCALHGFAYGTIYAPAQALFFSLDWRGTVAWIVAGLPFDIAHGVGNLLTGLLILPLVALLERLHTTVQKS